MRRREIQSTLMTLRQGDVIQLKVGINPKTQKPSFIPEFENGDFMADGEDTVRFFSPVNEVELNDGELWEVEVQDFNVSNKKSVDDRILVFVYVEVRKRIEETKQWIERDTPLGDWLYVEKKSGTRFLSLNKYPIRVERKWFVQNDLALDASLYYSEEKLIAVRTGLPYAREEYAAMLVRNGMGMISPTSAVKAFDKLPPLPEAEAVL